MACLNADGTLSPSGRALVAALATPSTPEEVARTPGLALYRVRSGLRELAAAGVVALDGDRYRATGPSGHEPRGGRGPDGPRGGG